MKSLILSVLLKEKGMYMFRKKKDQKRNLALMGCCIFLFAFTFIPKNALFAQEAWPSNWKPMLDVNWNYMQDPTGDKSPESVDVINDPNICSYFASSATSVFFRMALAGNPLNNKGELDQYAWMAEIDVNGDGNLDWNVRAAGISEKIQTYYYTGSTGTLNWQVDNPVSAGFVRAVDMGTFYFLDMQVPYTALQAGGYAYNITSNTPIRFFFHTSTTEAVDIKDATVNTTTISGGFALSGTTTFGGTSGGYGQINDSRDPSPNSSAGTWDSYETVLMNGNGWPPQGSAYYNGGVRNVRIKNSGGSVVWTGTVTTNTSGAFADAPTWTIPITAGSGLYTIEVEDPRSPGTWYSYDRFTVNQLTMPEMDVQGNGVSIADGDDTPSLDDHTDFGSVGVGSGTVTRTFTIVNEGTADLHLTGSPRVKILGDHASDFAVDVQPETPVSSGGGTTTFQITFDPSGTGVRSAEISIANDDSDENPYTFAIQGTGINTYTISGRILDEAGNPIPDVTVTFSYDGSTVTTDASGNYSKSDIPEGTDTEITPSKTNYFFNPVSISLTNIQSDQPGQDFTGAEIKAGGYACLPNFFHIYNTQGIVSRLDVSTNPFTYVTIATYGSHVNAAGYNNADGYIYMQDQSTKEIVKIGADGKFINTGYSLPSNNVRGDCDLSNHYLNFSANRLYIVDLSTTPYTHTTKTLSGSY